jgi:ribosomal protein S1
MWLNMKKNASTVARWNVWQLMLKEIPSNLCRLNLWKNMGETFKGVISGVTDWGIYVEIPENGAEGLIRLRDLTDDSYMFDAKIMLL